MLPNTFFDSFAMLEKNTLPKEYIVNVSYLAQEKRRDAVVSKHFFMPKLPIVSCPFAPNSDCKEFQQTKMWFKGAVSASGRPSSN